MPTEGPKQSGSCANDNYFSDESQWETADTGDPSTAAMTTAMYGVNLRTLSFGSGSPDSYMIKCTQFGFSIPTGATIDGIKVTLDVNLQVPGESYQDLHARIIKAGSYGSTEMASGANVWTTGYIPITYGASMTELWGETWTPADINDSGFGFGFAVHRNSGNNRSYLAWIQITVYYTEAGGGKVFQRRRPHKSLLRR